MGSQKSEEVSRYLTIQVILMLFTFVFFFTIAYGYFHLFIDAGWFLALLGGSIVAAFAWFLGRLIGTTPSGPWSDRKNYFFISILMIVSAAGVYNSMMVYIEGEKVLADTSTESQSYFNILATSANSELDGSGITTRIGRIHSLRDSLFSEINNPRNRGEGPEARRLMSELQRELPGFRPLSGSGRDGETNEAIIADYNSRIDDLIARADWNSPVMVSVSRDAKAATVQLEDMRTDINATYSPERIRQYVTSFEKLDGTYRKLRTDLATKANLEAVPSQLPLVAADSLGNVYKIIPLILSRASYPSTWVYLIMAVIFDLLLVSLFSILTESKVRKPSRSTTIQGAL
jgi:hypothetical protein